MAKVQTSSSSIIPAGSVVRLLSLAMGGGIVLDAVFAFQSSSAKQVLGVFGIGLAVASAATVCGALLGFLFGIPRSLQGNMAGAQGDTAHPPSGSATSSGGPSAATLYGANTSLEQISDWLTKILVGIGLTQLTQLPSALQSYSEFVGRALPNVAGGAVFVGAETLYFAICGFLASYLWTRLELGKALSAAEVVTRAEFEQEKQSNARALALVERQLRKGEAPPAEARLTQAIAAADDLYRAHIFELARATRKQAEAKADSETVGRTIPIFRALIARNPDSFHQNYGQLGFALLAIDPPDLDAAETQLSRAIELRGESWQRYGYEFYELARARCRIRRAKARGETQSAAALRQLIVQDLAALVAARFETFDAAMQSELSDWIRANQALDEVDPETRGAIDRLSQADPTPSS